MAAARILLVEDEGLIRLIASELLRDEGFDVVEAVDGDEAVHLLNGQQAFDALFTDVRMPGTYDGIGVAEHARSLHPAIPILIVSGYAAQLISRLAILDPQAVFISKPYSMDEVADMLKIMTRAP